MLAALSRDWRIKPPTVARIAVRHVVRQAREMSLSAILREN
jgi:hypothetical protein